SAQLPILSSSPSASSGDPSTKVCFAASSHSATARARSICSRMARRQLFRLYKAGVDPQGLIGSGFGFLQLSFTQQRLPLFQKLLSLRAILNPPHLEICLVEQRPRLRIGRVQLQGLTQKFASFGKVSLIEALLRLFQEVSDRLRLKSLAHWVQVAEYI